MFYFSLNSLKQLTYVIFIPFSIAIYIGSPMSKRENQLYTMIMVTASAQTLICKVG